MLRSLSSQHLVQQRVGTSVCSRATLLRLSNLLLTLFRVHDVHFRASRDQCRSDLDPILERFDQPGCLDHDIPGVHHRDQFLWRPALR
jgi:hypothetical protein